MSDHDVRAALRVLERCGLSGLSTESLQGLRDAVEQERVRRMRGEAVIVRMRSTWVRMDSGEVVETGSSVEVSDIPARLPPLLAHGAHDPPRCERCSNASGGEIDAVYHHGSCP